MAKPDPIPLHAQSASVQGALEVAVLVKLVPIEQGAELIELYARNMAVAAKIDGMDVVIDRFKSTEAQT